MPLLAVPSVLLVLALLVSLDPTYAGTCALYDDVPTPGIHCFHGNQLEKAITSSSVLWMVEFYSSWCGHCQHFAPVMKELGTEVKAWSSVFKLGVLECTDSKDNQKICDKHKIQGYPTLKFFSPGEKFPLKHSQIFQGGRSKKFIISKLISEIEQSSTVPTFPFITGSELLDTPQDQWMPMALVFERNDSFVGRRLILDFLSVHKSLIVRRVAESNTVLLKHYSVLELPSLVVELSNGDHHVIPGHSLKEPYETFKKMVLKYLDILHSPPPKEQRKPVSKPHPQDSNPTHSQFTPVKINRVHRDDLLSAVSYALRSEVAVHAIVSGSAYSTLLRFISLLEQSFAEPFPTASQCLQEVRRAVERQSSGSFITRTEWTRILDTKLDDTVFPINPHWKNCVGSRPHLRGYPCGLWMLMHTLTVLTLPLPHSTHLTVAGVTSKEALRTMSSFVHNFFSCQSCRDHFVAMASNLTSTIHHNGDAILWLWEAHNVVNRRLEGAVSSDPFYPKSHFPEAKTCPYCYQPVSGHVTLDHTHPNFINTGFLTGESLLSTDVGNYDYTWNRTAVLLYLWNFYHINQRPLSPSDKPRPLHVKPADIVKAAWPRLIPDSARLHAKYMNRAQLMNGHSIGFTSIDSGLCAMSYLMCIVSLCVLAYWLLSRRKRRKKFF